MLNFLILKYTALFLNGSRSFVLAKFLGPSDFGVYGSLITVQQYLSYLALGVRESTVVVIAQSYSDEHRRSAIISSSLLWSFSVGGVILIFASILFGFGLVSYHILLITVIGSFSIINEILINIARSQELLKRIAFYDILYNIPPAICLILFLGKVCITTMLISIIFGLFISVIGYLAFLKPWQKWLPSIKYLKKLVHIGIPLALNSAVTLSANSIYILLANLNGDLNKVGNICFALNLCSFLFFAINSIAWASTSRSLESHLLPKHSIYSDDFTSFIRNAFETGIISILIFSVGSVFILNYILPDFNKTGSFLILLALLQSYSFINFHRVNKLIIMNNIKFVLALNCFLISSLIILWFLKIITNLQSAILFSIFINVIITFILEYKCNKLSSENQVLKNVRLFEIFPLIGALVLIYLGKIYFLLFVILVGICPLKTFYKSYLKDLIKKLTIQLKCFTQNAVSN